MADRTPGRFIADTRRELDERRVKSGGLRYTKWQLLGTIVDDCGWHRRTEKRMTELMASLNEAGVFVYPRLDQPGLKLSDRIKFSDREWVAIEPDAFDNEKRLHRFVKDYFPELFSGTELEDLKFHGSQVPVDQGLKLRYLDLVFKDEEDRFVVVELKDAPAEPKDVGQLRNYMDLVGQTDSRVRGVLISARPASKEAEESIWNEIHDSRSYGDRIRWYWYSVPSPLTEAKMKRASARPR